MAKLILAHDILDKSKWEVLDDVNVAEVLSKRFDSMPENARLYLGEVCDAHDITPKTKEGVAALVNLDPKAVVIFANFPEGGVGAIFGGGFKAVTKFITSIFSLPKPTVQSREARNQRQGNSRDSLVGRTNEPRPLQRVPDIYGKLVAIPDMISPPLTKFIGNQEVEISQLVLGRGNYTIENVKDGDTPLASISGSSLQVYAPGTSPSSRIKDEHEPQLSIGTVIEEGNFTCRRLNEVNGQILEPPNSAYLNSYIPGVSYNDNEIIISESASTIILSDYFKVGDTVILDSPEVDISYDTETANYRGFVDPSGTFTVAFATETALVLDKPEEVNDTWLKMSQRRSDNPTLPVTARISNIQEVKWTDQFFLGDGIRFEELFLNFIAPQGLYKDNGESQLTESVICEVELVTCDNKGNVTPDSITTTHDFTIKGSSVVTSSRALTVKLDLDKTKNYLIRAKRSSNTDRGFDGSVVDEIRWRDCFGVEKLPDLNFPECTTIIAQTLATAGAAAVKERKLTMLVSRLLPSRDDDGVAGELKATSSPREIIPAIYTDKAIGGGNYDDIDFSSLSDACEAVAEYFGTSIPLAYGNAFTAGQISVEEMIVSICDTCFIRVYRNGDKITFRADIPTQLPRLLFNHRNKRPDTEKRTVRFGVLDDYDGVKITWQDESGAPQDVYLPNENVRRPNEIRVEGVSSEQHATLHAWRAWNKMRYQNLAISFDGLAECAFVNVKDAILVADMTRSDTIAGEIEAVEGLTLTIKPNKKLEEGATYSCHLQYSTGVVQAIDVASYTQTTLTLTTPPAFSLSTDIANSMKALFILVKVGPDRTSTRVLITRKAPKENSIYTITGINDDDRYYAQDRLYAEE